MPWEMIATGVAVVLFLAAGVYVIRQRSSSTGPIPDVGQPPADSEPMVEPRLQDIGFGSYELPLSDTETDPARNQG